MQPRERLIVYGLLFVLLGVNVAVLLGAGQASAFAQDPLADTHDATPATAAAVNSLTLSGEDGSDIVLRNRGQRLAWGDAAHDRAYSIGYVYIGRVLKQLMQAEEFEEDRERLITELNETDADYRGQLDDIRAQLGPLEEGSEEAGQILQQGQLIYEEFSRWQQQAIAQRGKLDAEHLERAYRNMIDAVEVVSDRKDIDTIYRFIPTDEAFQADNPDQAMVAIRLRTALRYPNELDITDDVMDELSLDLDE